MAEVHQINGEKLFIHKISSVYELMFQWLPYRTEIFPVCSSLWFSQGSGGIPLARKMCYAVGGVPYQITTIAIGVSLQIFLLDVVQVRVKVVLTNIGLQTRPLICISSYTMLCTYLNFKIKHPSILQMEASYVSMILFVSRAWDAVTDPLVGYLVSRSNWTPIGKLAPWLVGWVVGGATCLTHFMLN